MESIFKQVEFAKSHSNIEDGRGACIFKGKKVLVVGFSHLPSNFHYTSEDSKQHNEIHISAVHDVIMKIGSYRKVTYMDLDIAVSDEPTIQELGLIVEMKFKKLWIFGNPKPFDPTEYFIQVLKLNKIRL